MIRTALIQALRSMSEKDALDLVAALGQWADNQRNFVDESDPAELEASELAKLAVAEKFVEAGECALVLHVEHKHPSETAFIQI